MRECWIICDICGNRATEPNPYFPDQAGLPPGWSVLQVQDHKFYQLCEICTQNLMVRIREPRVSDYAAPHSH